MLDNKDLEAEIYPLKNEERKSQENLGNPSKNEDNLKSTPPQAQLSRCRTVAFFLSLFLCLFVVFVVSFVIPCPDRPASQRMWRTDYNAAVTYDFLAVDDINGDRIQDILFLYKNTNSSNNFNQSCMDEGFSSSCTFAAALSGANGSTLWERPVAQDVAFVECAVPRPRGGKAPPSCILVGRPGSFTAVNFFTGWLDGKETYRESLQVEVVHLSRLTALCLSPPVTPGWRAVTHGQPDVTCCGVAERRNSLAAGCSWGVCGGSAQGEPST
ncbi:hypothetical protein P7K49_022604 [Saguinus oedipus]|uniref:FAM234A/B beta-propeller domain-containing protein n=1 Tax=Saguinus oedipus TaxID=9490 RepID=A0ABQ9UJB1_SAGOE|nr:hypothetical protein P7K49_022604 [Saguinus oedipus]